MENFENKINPTEKKENGNENKTSLEMAADLVKTKFGCTKSEATVFLVHNQEQFLNQETKKIDPNIVEKYLETPEAKEDFTNFRLNFKKFHETPESQ